MSKDETINRRSFIKLMAAASAAIAAGARPGASCDMWDNGLKLPIVRVWCSIEVMELIRSGEISLDLSRITKKAEFSYNHIPFRFDKYRDDGYPDLIEPSIERNGNWFINQAWLDGRYEVVVVFGRDWFQLMHIERRPDYVKG